MNKTQISLAVGAALALGGFTSAYAAAPVTRAAQPVLVSNLGTLNDTTKKSLLSTTGLINTAITLDVTLDSAVGTGTGNCKTAGLNVDGTIQVAGSPTETVANNCDLVVGNATLANNHVVAYTGTTTTQVPSTGATASLSPSVSGVAHITFNLPAPGANKGYRLTAGALEFSSDTSVAAPVWAAVKVDVQAVTGKEIYTENDATAETTADTAVLVAQTGKAVGNSLAPTPTIATASAAGGTLVNGFVISTYTPITLASANLAVATRAPVAVVGAIPAAAVTVGTCAANKCPVTLGLGVAAATGGVDLVVAGAVAPITDAADVAAYSSANFNTGVAGATVPFTVDGTATEATYTEVFTVATGVASTLAKFGAAGAGDAAAFADPAGNGITDGAQPAIVSVLSSSSTGTTTLSLTFSEALYGIGATVNSPGNTLAEVGENVKVGTDSLAALNLNAAGVLGVSLDNATTAGRGIIVITGVQAADVTGKQVQVSQGISVLENNDAGFVAGTPAIETTAGEGVTTNANEFLSAALTSVTAPPLTIAFTDTTCSAQTIVSPPTKVGSIVCKFPAGKEVQLNTAAPAKTLSDLANDLVVVVNGLAGKEPVVFDVHPAAADLALSATGDSLTITLPTALIYANIDQVAHMDVTYQTTAPFVGGDVLVGKASPNPVVSTGTEDVSLPFSVTGTSNTLMTQSIVGTLVGASNGSVVRAYLGKWRENPSNRATGTASIKSGFISLPGDKVLSKLAIGFADQATLETSIATNRGKIANAVTPIPGVRDAATPVTAASITVYAAMCRTNDTRPNSNGGGSYGGDDYLQAQVWLGTTYALAADKCLGVNVNKLPNEPVYLLTLDPVSGKLDGTLQGNLSISFTADVNNPGLTVFDGTTFAAPPVAFAVGEGLVDATGKFNLLVGTDAVKTEDLAGGLGAFANQFLILVHEDQSNSRRYTQLTSANPGRLNYVPFEPNLASLKGNRTVLGAPTKSSTSGIAAPFLALTGTPANIDLANYKVGTAVNEAVTTAWRIGSSVNPAVALVPPPSASFVRNRVGLKGDGLAVSTWTGDGAGADMAMTMTNSKVFLATELGNNKGTLNTITNASYTPGARATAFKGDAFPATSVSFANAQGAPITGGVKVGVGWSLVSAPSATLNSSTVDAIIRVGAQASSQFTWIKATDGTQPTLTVDEGVFVFSSKGGTL